MIDSSHTRHALIVQGAIVLALIIACVACATAHGATRNVGTPLPHIVTQCPISSTGNANDCESYIISGNPTPHELGEATAKVPYLVIACVLVKHEARYCVRSVTPIGDQIIAPPIIMVDALAVLAICVAVSMWAATIYYAGKKVY